MKKIVYLVLLLVVTSLCGCNDWLDVKPKTQFEREEYYSSEDGFRSALTGCYMKLKDRSLYGEQLTMSSVEYMAQHWVANGDGDRDLMNFQWDTKTSEQTLKNWYSRLYTVIAQANDLLDYLEKKGEVIESAERRKMIQGEALAIRAFCHFDLLRLFGQLPDNDTITRNLAYAEKTGNEPVPFYDFATFTGKVLRDFSDAAALLKESDPVMHYSFETLNKPKEAIEKGYIQDDFDAYRRIRFNYWAVKALQARAYLYIGDKPNAWSCANEVIGAQIDGQPVSQLSALEDYTAGYYILPNEVLAGLNVYNIDTYVSTLFRGKSMGGLLYKSESADLILNDIFQGLTSDRRRDKVWTNVQGGSSARFTVKKYWQSSSALDDEASTKLDMNRQMVPLIRLAEVYLIAVESAPTVAEANLLMREFKTSRDLPYTDQNRVQIDEDVLNEYRKELYAEGQMFFTYKRLGKKTMLWRSKEVSEGNYVLLIPKTEVAY